MSADSHYPPHALGRFGERAAADALVGEGWRVLAANYRLGRREVDLVVRREHVVAFVEVKTRSGSGFGPPEEAVTRRKRREIEAVARDYLLRHDLGDVDVRFDIVAIEVERGTRVVRLAHLEDAWRPASR